MSIINEAIKKARKESGIKNTDAPPAPDLTRELTSIVSPHYPEPSEIKWTAVITVSIVIIVSLLGSLVLYKHVTVQGVDQPQVIPGVMDTASSPAAAARPKITPPITRTRGMLELNGIAHGPDDKWAIVNNKIVREGDVILGGRLTHIAKDFVRIKEDNGGEFILDLR